MNARRDDGTHPTPRALTEREVAESARPVGRHAAGVAAPREGPSFPAARPGRALSAGGPEDFVRASAVDAGAGYRRLMADRSVEELRP